MKIFIKIILIFTLFLVAFTGYFSLVGIKTNKFNTKIKNNLTNIDKDFDIDLNQVNLRLKPIELKINVKILGSKIIYKRKALETESIKTEISLISFFKNEFIIQSLDISTKSVDIKDLISFTKTFYYSPELIIFEKLSSIKGFLIADIKIYFDDNGVIKDNYYAKGYIKDTKLNLLKNFDLDELNFIFKIEKDSFEFRDIEFLSNNIDFRSKKINIKKIEQGYLFKGFLNNETVKLDNKNLTLFKEKFLPDLILDKIRFSSKNEFSFILDKNFRIKNEYLSSDINIEEFQITNNFKLKDIFPEINNQIIIKNNNVKIEYIKKNFTIEGNGEIYLQKNKDNIDYKIEKKDQLINFSGLIKLDKDPFIISYLNFEKDQNFETRIKFSGYKDTTKQFFLKSLSLEENKNTIVANGIQLSSKLKIKSIDNINANYIDTQDEKNIFNIKKNNKRYIVKGDSFNGENLIEDILFSDEEKNYFDEDFELILNIKNINLDREFNLKNLTGNLIFKNQKLVEGSLVGDFPGEKKMNFSVRTNDNKIITTLFLDFAEPIVKKYKFIKGFDSGVLDFYSIKDANVSNSTLKIYDFKLKELPTLTKLLTLASLQGIADILSGEGIRFDEFEMKFENKNKLMNINEIFAIGPAISVLMNGYVEKDKLISLRGTLVPATTINKAIGTIPVLGKILVGSKTGEGIFGVSFKIKGPPKKLETTVNPIKTLTPRFITRTLEKIKKN